MFGIKLLFILQFACMPALAGIWIELYEKIYESTVTEGERNVGRNLFSKLDKIVDPIMDKMVLTEMDGGKKRHDISSNNTDKMVICNEIGSGTR